MTHVQRRFWEMLPGMLVWLTFVISIVLSFMRPLWMIYFVILFDLYWLLRILYFTPFTLISWWRYRQALRRNWQVDVEGVVGYESVHHLIFLPTYKEELPVVQETLRVLAHTAYPASRLIVVLAGEERDRERFMRIVEAVRGECEERFFRFWVTTHPDLPDEIPGKGSNLHWAGHAILPQIEALGLNPDRVIVSSFDIDTIVHPQYFSCLTHRYLTIPEPTRSSYQPVAVYNNNLWVSPAPVRVAMFGTTFWLMTELARPEGMMTFSSHSMSLRMLMDVGFWQKDIVSEDSRIFLQGLTHYHGHYRVTPIYLPVSMDTVMTGTYGTALIALYKQLRRWAWGVENFPYMIERFWSDPLMPRRSKIAWTFKQLEGMYTWATAPFLIFILGYLPFVLSPERFRSFVIFQSTPFTLQWLMRLAMIGLFISAGLSLTLLPPRPQSLSRSYAYTIMLLQWALLPVTFILFGAIPAIDAQTRFLLGKPLGFLVSPKRKIT